MNTSFTIRINRNATHYFNTLFRKKRKADSHSIIVLFRQTITKTRNQCKESTHKNKVTAVNAFERFLNKTKKGTSPITIDNLTADHIKAFERWALDEGQSPGYVALHMRNLRALINRINGRGNELFRLVRTANCQTEKRAVSEDTIKQIRELELAENTSIALTRDIFLFCFYGMGIPLIDAVMLRKSQLQGGYISYRRQKTNRKVKIKVSAELQQLLDLLSPADSPYLLPILTTNDRADAKRQYLRFYQRYMRALRKIETLLDLDYHITSYTPRHSWASIAYRNNVDINIIARALGHANTNITYAYIKEINDSQLESANIIVTRAVQ